MKSDEIRFIKEAIACIEYEKCYLFGSQARGDESSNSDYDLLIIVANDMTQEEKFFLADRIRDKIAPHLIALDIIIKSAVEADRYRHLTGSVVKNVIAEGILI